MSYALFCEKCKLGSFFNEKIDKFTCNKCIDDQPERSKREDRIGLYEWHKRCAFGLYSDAVL